MAYRLASALLEQGWEQIEVNLVEPTLPGRYLPVEVKLQRYLRRARKWIGKVARIVLRQAPAPIATVDAKEIPDVEARWTLMVSHFAKTARSARLVPLGRRIGLAGTRSYIANGTECWNRVEPAGVDQCILPIEEGHELCFRHDCGMHWLQFLERTYYRMCGRSSRDDAQTASAHRPVGADEATGLPDSNQVPRKSASAVAMK